MNWFQRSFAVLLLLAMACYSEAQGIPSREIQLAAYLEAKKRVLWLLESQQASQSPVTRSDYASDRLIRPLQEQVLNPKQLEKQSPNCRFYFQTLKDIYLQRALALYDIRRWQGTSPDEVILNQYKLLMLDILHRSMQSLAESGAEGGLRYLLPEPKTCEIQNREEWIKQFAQVQNLFDEQVRSVFKISKIFASTRELPESFKQLPALQKVIDKRDISLGVYKVLLTGAAIFLVPADVAAGAGITLHWMIQSLPAVAYYGVTNGLDMKKAAELQASFSPARGIAMHLLAMGKHHIPQSYYEIIGEYLRMLAEKEIGMRELQQKVIQKYGSIDNGIRHYQGKVEELKTAGGFQ